MAVREFDGVDDKIVLGGDGSEIGNDAYSIVVITKPASLASDEIYLSLQNSTSHLIAGFCDGGGTDRLAINAAGSTFATQAAGITAGDWQIIAATKAAGTSVVRFHRKILGSGSWTHASTSGTLADDAATWDHTELGADLAGGSFKDCRMAAAAVYASALSDADIESIQTDASSQQLLNLGAVAVWDLNQASTATAVVDLVGNADQTALTGTTVVTGDDPPGWSFGVAQAPENTVSPAIAGTQQVGETLTCTPGTWTGSPTPTITRKWQRSDDGSTGWTDISGETGTTYDLVSDDLAKYVRVLEQGANTGGTVTEPSNALGPIDPEPPLDFSVRLSGGASNSDPTASIGGAESSTHAGTNLFDTVIGVQARDGHTDYRLVYVHNDDTEDGTVSAWINDDTDTYPGDAHLTIGAAAESAGSTVDAVDDETTAPDGVSFSNPNSAETGVDLGTIAAGSMKGVWIKRAYGPGASASPSTAARVIFTVTPA